MEEEPTFAEDDRAVELTSIAAIFPELEIEPGSRFKASLNIPVSPTTPLKVHFPRNGTVLQTPSTSAEPEDVDTEGCNRTKRSDRNDDDSYHLSHLPPLKLHIELPEGYPDMKPPELSITTHPDWLPHPIVYSLLVDGLSLWEEFGRNMMVYSYIDHLQQRAESAFNIQGRLGVTVSFPSEMKTALLDFDQRAEREKFERETFVCGICLEPKKGGMCRRLLLCSHVFCVRCLQDFFTSCIQEGDVTKVKCATPGCSQQSLPDESAGPGRAPARNKQDRTLTPSELLQVPLEQELVQRYAFLKRKNKLESDKTTIYCPRKWCQGAARSKKHPKPDDPLRDFHEVAGEEEDGVQPFDPLGDESQLPATTERLAVCEDCEYAFCRVCKRGWHGELIYCFPRRQAELTEEEKATLKYLESFTAPCPSCNARCQKSHGCNHMICFKCRTHFCYLCSSWLFPGQPYQHYNTISSPCYMRLWEGEAGVQNVVNHPTEDDIWDALVGD